MISAINTILKNPLSHEQVVRLYSAPTWSLISSQDQFTFIETTKGVIHRNFVDLLTEFGCSYKQASSVIISALSGLVDLLQKVVWRARCDDQIQAENYMESINDPNVAVRLGLTPILLVIKRMTMLLLTQTHVLAPDRNLIMKNGIYG